MIELFLPWPPSINNYYLRTKYGTALSKRGRLYRDDCAKDILEQLGGGFNPISTPINLAVILYPPDKRKRDLDNHLKALQDALTHSGVYSDDSLIDQLSVYRGEVVKSSAPGSSGHCYVRLCASAPILRNTRLHYDLI